MAIKGQKFRTYSEELKLEAIRMHVEEKWTYRQINDHFGIQDEGRKKRWMRHTSDATAWPSGQHSPETSI